MVLLHHRPEWWPYDRMLRHQVVEALRSGSTFDTVRREGGGGWGVVGRVRLVAVGRRPYIRTDDEPVAADDLGELPDF